MSYLDWDTTESFKVSEIRVHFVRGAEGWHSDVSYQLRYLDTLYFKDGEWGDEYTHPKVKAFVDSEWTRYLQNIVVGDRDD